MKKVLVLLLTLSLLLLAGCGTGQSASKTLDLDAFTAGVLEKVEYDDELIALTEKNVAN